MYDLRIGTPDSPEYAIECVGAVDPMFTETWNIGPAKGPMHLGLLGDWWIEIKPTALMKNIQKNIEQILHRMVDEGLYNLSDKIMISPFEREIFKRLRKLDINSVSESQYHSV